MRVIPALIGLEPAGPLAGTVLYQCTLQSCSAQTKPRLFPLQVLNPCRRCPERFPAGSGLVAGLLPTPAVGKPGSTAPDR